jgi:hypothetical protein
MTQVTVDEIIQAVEQHGIKIFEYNVCDSCHRGELFRFCRTNELIKEQVYYQSGCDCRWIAARPSSYEVVAELFNQQSAEVFTALWASFLTAGLPQQDKITAKALPPISFDPPPITAVKTAETSTGSKQQSGLAFADIGLTTQVVKSCPFCNKPAACWYGPQRHSGNKRRCAFTCSDPECIAYSMRPVGMMPLAGKILADYSEEGVLAYAEALAKWNRRLGN